MTSSTTPSSDGHRGPVRVLGIVGSLRARSFNAALMEAAIELAPPELEIERAPSIRDIPPFDDDVRHTALPPAVAALGDRVRAADGVLIATPEYNHGVPGVLKNALDWVSCACATPAENPMRHKPVALMGASIGLMGTVRAQQDIRRYCHFTDAHAMLRPEVFVTLAGQKFDDDLRLVDEPTRALLEGFLAGFRDFIGWLRAAGPPPAPAAAWSPPPRPAAP